MHDVMTDQQEVTMFKASSLEILCCLTCAYNRLQKGWRSLVLGGKLKTNKTQQTLS
jgi:hypothetical protein